MKKNVSSHLFVHRMQIGRQAAPLYCIYITFYLVMLLGALVWSVGPLAVYAQNNTNSAADNPSPAVREVSDNEVKEVAQELWCPLCSGVRLDTCELKACEQMRQEIAIQLANGESVESIKAYFLDQYGPQVLGEPPREGFNLLAWIVPFAVLLGAAGVLLFRSRRLLSQRTAMQTAGIGLDAVFFEDDELDNMSEDNMPENVSDNLQDDTHIVQNGEPADSYERALDEELRQYE